MRPQNSARPTGTEDRLVPGAARARLAPPDEQRRLRVVGGGETADIDECVAHFFVLVASLCGDARIGGLTLSLKLSNGTEIAGVAEPVRQTEGADQLAGTGYADAVTVDGVAVALSDVVEASIVRPAGGAALG